jgi:hypothetical protein
MAWLPPTDSEGKVVSVIRVIHNAYYLGIFWSHLIVDSLLYQIHRLSFHATYTKQKSRNPDNRAHNMILGDNPPKLQPHLSESGLKDAISRLLVCTYWIRRCPAPTVVSPWSWPFLLPKGVWPSLSLELMSISSRASSSFTTVSQSHAAAQERTVFGYTYYLRWHRYHPAPATVSPLPRGLIMFRSDSAIRLEYSGL